MEYIEVINRSSDLDYFINYLKKQYPTDQLSKSIMKCYKLQGVLGFVATTTKHEDIRTYCLITLSELADLIEFMWDNVEDYLYDE